jgi:hypothetical protein
MPENDKYDFIIICAGAWSNYILEKKDIHLKANQRTIAVFQNRRKINS